MEGRFPEPLHPLPPLFLSLPPLFSAAAETGAGPARVETPEVLAGEGGGGRAPLSTSSGEAFLFRLVESRFFEHLGT